MAKEKHELHLMYRSMSLESHDVIDSPRHYLEIVGVEVGKEYKISLRLTDADVARMMKGLHQSVSELAQTYQDSAKDMQGRASKLESIGTDLQLALKGRLK